MKNTAPLETERHDPKGASRLKRALQPDTQGLDLAIEHGGEDVHTPHHRRHFG